ncbi:hypothetical protein FQN50_004414 [Emmonsiellopsis sp. PD_5]|nr:hypothetical protein FQN50_004414 [Emmonsiellopsis sp. PD_5]
MHFPLPLLLLSLPLLTTAKCTTNPNPSPQPSNPPSTPPTPSNLTHALTHISPPSAREPCLSDKIAPNECRSASQAAPHIQSSFDRYGISSPAERAALVSLMVMESGGFVYARSHFPEPGVRGKGTRNMQSPHYNTLYAHSIPSLSHPLSKLNPPDDVGATLDLLLSNDEYDFGSAAWFLTSQCTPEVRRGLQSGSREGWVGYLTGCVGTTVTEGREGYWRRAMEVFK